MSEEDSAQPVPIGEQADPEVLLYDFSKFQATLSLLLLGGVLTLTDGEGTAQIDRARLIQIIALLAGGGAFALSCADAIVRARLAGRPLSRWIKVLQYGSIAGLSLGTGSFLAGWLDLLP